MLTKRQRRCRVKIQERRKEMKVNINDKEKVDEALAVLNARVRNATHDDVTRMVTRIERALERKGLLRKHWTGLRFQCNPNPEKFPNAYKGIPMATYFTVERYPSGWFLAGVERKECRTEGIALVSELGEEQKQGVLNAFYKF
jgi:hypothetical protein